MISRNRDHLPPHERAIQTQILDALLRIEELLQSKDIDTAPKEEPADPKVTRGRKK